MLLAARISRSRQQLGRLKGLPRTASGGYKAWIDKNYGFPIAV
jgi:hypothetical protein